VSQRIDVLRSVFSVNLNSSIAEKPGSGYAPPQSRQPGRMHLRAVSPPAPVLKQPARMEAVSPPPDRRMFRRRVDRLIPQPPGVSRHGIKSSPPASSFPVDDLLIDNSPSFHAGKELMEQAAVLAAKHEAVLAKPVVIEDTFTDPEDIAESYIIDRPVFLLSQKYFGTRF